MTAALGPGRAAWPATVCAHAASRSAKHTLLVPLEVQGLLVIEEEHPVQMRWHSLGICWGPK